MTFIKEIFLGREKLFTPNAIIFHGALLAMSFAFVYVFSYSTSFGYDLLGGDSAIFQVVGKYWTQGYLPYVELFENKGPLLFFIDAIGYAIYPRSGIMVPQIIFLYLSCLFIWRAMELYSSSKWKVFFLLLTLIYYAAHYEEGNHVTEYTLPFLSAAVYCFLLSLKEDKFPPLYAFIYGLGFGGCFLIRLSDAAQICCQCFLIAVFLLQARDFKTLWQNFLSFLAGFAAIVLPFVIYFAAHDALYDMIYGTIIFNVKYALENTSPTTLLFRVYYSAFHYLPLFAIIIVAALALKQKPKSRLLWSGIFVAVIMTLMFLKLHIADQYEMIVFATAPLLFAVLHESRDALQRIWDATGFSTKRLLIKIFLVAAVFQVYVMIFFLKAAVLNEETLTYMFFTSYSKQAEVANVHERENVLSLKALIPDDERNSFVCWGDTCTGAHWILQTGIKPRNRFFTNVRWMAKADLSLRDEWFDDVRCYPPLWILYGTDPNRKTGAPLSWTEDTELEKLLAEKYSLKGEVFIYPQMMKLYKLKG